MGGRGTTGPFLLPYHISPSPTRPAVSAHLAPHPPAAPSRRVAGKPLYVPTRTPTPRVGRVANRANREAPNSPNRAESRGARQKIRQSGDSVVREG